MRMWLGGGVYEASLRQNFDKFLLLVNNISQHSRIHLFYVIHKQVNLNPISLHCFLNNKV